MPKQTKAISKIEFNDDTIALIKSSVAQGATDAELNLFLYQAKRSGLDPLTRQIYFIKMGGRPVMMASIDGFRVIAERSGNYAGQDEPIFIYDANQPNVLLCCKVKIYKWHGKDRFLAATGVAFMNEYRVANSTSWIKMPHVMLSKVAESKALRQAFPQDLSGLYTSEEMEQGKEEAGSEPAARPAVLATEFQTRKIFALGQSLGKTGDETKEIVKKHYKLASFKDLSLQQASQLIESMEKKVAAIFKSEEAEIDFAEVDKGIAEQQAAQADTDPDWIKVGTTEPV